MTRRTVLRQGLAASAAGLAGCAENKMTANITRSLQRIEELDRAGPALRAVIEVNPDAHRIANELISQPERSALHGMAILIKDNIDTADKMQTTAGSLALMDSKPKADAEIVRLLREAGLVIIGKTNMSEWANIRSPKSTSGWSARGGLARHPHRLPFNASGSSSGSAVSVAAGYTSLAIGTETNGSIVSPASACGIVGFKPTLGLVSQRGIIPITHHQDTAGPMTRSVRAAALLMQVISDATTRNAHQLDFASGLGSDALKGVRLGVLREHSGEHPEVLAQFEKALEVMRGLGAIIVEAVALPNVREASRASWTALFAELRTDLNAYLQSRDGEVRSLAELIAFNEKHRDQELPHFGQEFFIEAEKLSTPEALAIAAAARLAATRLAGPDGIDAALKEQQLDALVCATNDPTERSNLDGSLKLPPKSYKGHSCAGPPAIAGYPHLTMPMGFVDDLPVGLSFMGTAWSDARLLAYGHALERALPAFREPLFKPV